MITSKVVKLHREPAQYQLVNTWNGGKRGRIIVCTGSQNRCFQWILENTPFSYYEATTNQGYVLEICE